MQHVTLTNGTTAFKRCKRGLLISSIGEYTATMFYVPRTNSLTVTTLGQNTTLKFGKSLKITLPDDMWADHADSIISAALGEDVTS